MAKSFLDLPKEVRIIIYEILLVKDGAIEPDTIQPPSSRPDSCLDPDGTALMRTCRSIHAETVPILYGKNSFMLGVRLNECSDLDPGMTEMIDFIHSIGAGNRKALTNVEFCTLGYADEELKNWDETMNWLRFVKQKFPVQRALSILAKGHNLQTVSLEIENVSQADGQAGMEYGQGILVFFNREDVSFMRVLISLGSLKKLWITNGWQIISKDQTDTLSSDVFGYNLKLCDSILDRSEKSVSIERLFRIADATDTARDIIRFLERSDQSIDFCHTCLRIHNLGTGHIPVSITWPKVK